MNTTFLNNGNVAIEGARIIFRNFTGRQSKFNTLGNRNFCCVVDPETGEKLKEVGWNVRILAPRDSQDDPTYYIPVAVAYNWAPPKIELITSKNKVEITEETVDSLDYAEIHTADLELRPYHWEVNGNKGVKAYLKTLRVVIEEDFFASKYENVGRGVSEEPYLEDIPLPFS